MLAGEQVVAVPRRPEAGAVEFEDRPATGNFPKVIDCLHAAGFTTRLTELDSLDRDLEGVSAIVIPGGGDIDPSRYGGPSDPRTYGVDAEQDELDLTLVAHAVRHGIPLLGICRGAQIINVAHGGTLHEDLPDTGLTHHHEIATSTYPDMFVSHEVSLSPSSRVASAVAAYHLPSRHAETPTRIAVRSAHHQGIRDLGFGLAATGHADDGLIEAFEAVDGWIVGVQWHPEAELADGPLRLGLFDALARATRNPELVARSANMTRRVYQNSSNDYI